MSTITTCSVIRRRRLSRRRWRGPVAVANGEGGGLGGADSAPSGFPTGADTAEMEWDNACGENLGSGLPGAAATRDSPAVPAGIDSEAAERAVVIYLQRTDPGRA